MVGNLVTPDGKLDTSIMLPPLNIAGDLPAGIHAAGWNEIEQRFGIGSPRRVTETTRNCCANS